MNALALTFLDPLTGLVAAAASVPALLLLYFLKLRRRPVRVTASFLWQRAAEDLQVNTPFRWLRVSVVLLLQLLALLSLCAALARPALSDAPPAGGRVIVLLDASASMRAADAGGGATRFDEAKRRVAEFLDGLDLGAEREGQRTEAMLMVFALEPRVLASFTTDRGELARALAGAAPTDQPGDLPAALAAVDAFAAQAAQGEDARAPLLVVFSDGGPAGGGAPLSAAVREARFVRAGPPGGEPKSNLGVTALSARRDDATPSTVRLFVRIANASSDPVETAAVVEVDGAPRGAERAVVPGAADDAPGERALALEVAAPGRSVITFRLPGEDALGSDDRASLVIDAPGGVDVVLVAPVGQVPGRAAPNVFLREALDALRARSIRLMTLAQYEEALRATGPASLDGADLVIYDRVEPDALPRAPSISFGAGLPVDGLRVSTPEGAARATRFLSWRRTDPLLRAVSLGETLVARPMRVLLPEPGGRVGEVDALAYGDDGPLIAALTVGGVRRVVVGFDLAQSTWPLDVGFAIFLANAVESLAPRVAMATGRSFSTSEPLTVAAAPGATRVVAEGPATLEAPAPDAADPERVVSLGAAPLAGLYDVRGAIDDDAIAAVNVVDADETSIATRDALPIATRSGTSAAAGEAASREVWWWFALAAGGLMVLEWLLFAWRMRV